MDIEEIPQYLKEHADLTYLILLGLCCLLVLYMLLFQTGLEPPVGSIVDDNPAEENERRIQQLRNSLEGKATEGEEQKDYRVIKGKNLVS